MKDSAGLLLEIPRFYPADKTSGTFFIGGREIKPGETVIVDGAKYTLVKEIL